MWKKSGAWFLGTLPTFTLTSSPSSTSVSSTTRRHSTSPSVSSLQAVNSLSSVSISPISADNQSTSSLTSLPTTQTQQQPSYHQDTNNSYQQHHQQQHQSPVKIHTSSKMQNSTRILSASPVIRRKTNRSPSPRMHRNAAFPFNTNSATGKIIKCMYDDIELHQNMYHSQKKYSGCISHMNNVEFNLTNYNCAQCNLLSHSCFLMLLSKMFERSFLLFFSL